MTPRQGLTGSCSQPMKLQWMPPTSPTTVSMTLGASRAIGESANLRLDIKGASHGGSICTQAHRVQTGHCYTAAPRDGSRQSAMPLQQAVNQGPAGRQPTRGAGPAQRLTFNLQQLLGAAGCRGPPADVLAPARPPTPAGSSPWTCNSPMSDRSEQLDLTCSSPISTPSAQR